MTGARTLSAPSSVDRDGEKLLRHLQCAEGGTVSSNTAAELLLILATLCVLGMRPGFVFRRVLDRLRRRAIWYHFILASYESDVHSCALAFTPVHSDGHCPRSHCGDEPTTEHKVRRSVPSSMAGEQHDEICATYSGRVNRPVTLEAAALSTIASACPAPARRASRRIWLRTPRETRASGMCPVRTLRGPAPDPGDVPSGGDAVRRPEHAGEVSLVGEAGQ
jgi:hypothetical protein